ncbi:MAG: DUF4150 domain-containing protein [Mesorhizobium sp.]|uniref:DUF4150 domain-containing protein n=1 Tax=Mesorhizobium sp. TaxID=1871066 RepID=UPI00122BBD0A|nr:DUF4150 domain-containing protein [Mesorhizobium sp.]TIM32611.1 MAG: DUF4150 domain-containing protein [Mesorhizobium sp.]
MSCTVFATTMGFFHQDSNGQCVAPGDVGLTPPPPPGGPLPVPYVNIAIARNLAKGSKSVKIQATPTALENVSNVSTSSGDEPATQGGGVVSHNTSGTATFTTWSFTVKVEGKGVCSHGDLTQQNNNGTIPNCLDPAAIVQFAVALFQLDMLKPCAEPYNPDTHRPDKDPSKAQEKAVDGKPCWECSRDHGETKAVWNTVSTEKVGDVRQIKQEGAVMSRGSEAMTHDHQPPLAVAWEMGGCHMGPAKFKELFDKPEMVKPHCQAHYRSQGSRAGAYARHLRRG